MKSALGSQAAALLTSLGAPKHLFSNISGVLDGSEDLTPASIARMLGQQVPGLDGLAGLSALGSLGSGKQQSVPLPRGKNNSSSASSSCQDCEGNPLCDECLQMYAATGAAGTLAAIGGLAALAASDPGKKPPCGLAGYCGCGCCAPRRCCCLCSCGGASSNILCCPKKHKLFGIGCKCGDHIKFITSPCTYITTKTHTHKYTYIHTDRSTDRSTDRYD